MVFLRNELKKPKIDTDLINQKNSLEVQVGRLHQELDVKNNEYSRMYDENMRRVIELQGTLSMKEKEVIAVQNSKYREISELEALLKSRVSD